MMKVVTLLFGMISAFLVKPTDSQNDTTSSTETYESSSTYFSHQTSSIPTSADSLKEIVTVPATTEKKIPFKMNGFETDTDNKYFLRPNKDAVFRCAMEYPELLVSETQYVHSIQIDFKTDEFDLNVSAYDHYTEIVRVSLDQNGTFESNKSVRSSFPDERWRIKTYLAGSFKDKGRVFYVGAWLYITSVTRKDSGLFRCAVKFKRKADRQNNLTSTVSVTWLKVESTRNSFSVTKVPLRFQPRKVFYDGGEPEEFACTYAENLTFWKYAPAKTEYMGDDTAEGHLSEKWTKVASYQRNGTHSWIIAFLDQDSVNSEGDLPRLHTFTDRMSNEIVTLVDNHTCEEGVCWFSCDRGGVESRELFVQLEPIKVESLIVERRNKNVSAFVMNIVGPLARHISWHVIRLKCNGAKPFRFPEKHGSIIKQNLLKDTTGIPAWLYVLETVADSHLVDNKCIYQVHVKLVSALGNVTMSEDLKLNENFKVEKIVKKVQNVFEGQRISENLVFAIGVISVLTLTTLISGCLIRKFNIKDDKQDRKFSSSQIHVLERKGSILSYASIDRKDCLRANFSESQNTPATKTLICTDVDTAISVSVKDKKRVARRRLHSSSPTKFHRGLRRAEKQPQHLSLPSIAVTELPSSKMEDFLGLSKKQGIPQKSSVSKMWGRAQFYST